MKTVTIVGGLAVATSLAAAFWQWHTAQDLRHENEQLQHRIEFLQAQSPAESAAANDKAAAALEKTRAEALELARLRSEVSQLRTSAKEGEALKARNEQLRAENQQLRGASSGVQAAAAPAPTHAGAGDTFARESWSFAGYTSPESALVSAIWAMREGNPKTYLESLAPEEQARMAQVWANKSETELAAKHQSDVSKITSIRVVDRQETSPDQVTMSVYIGGVDRLEKVSMQRVGNDWKFGGFLREPKR